MVKKKFPRVLKTVRVNDIIPENDGLFDLEKNGYKLINKMKIKKPQSMEIHVCHGCKSVLYMSTKDRVFEPFRDCGNCHKEMERLFWAQ